MLKWLSSIRIPSPSPYHSTVLTDLLYWSTIYISKTMHKFQGLISQSASTSIITTQVQKQNIALTQKPYHVPQQSGPLLLPICDIYPYFCLLQIRLVLLIYECYLNEITQFVFVCGWHLLINIMFLICICSGVCSNSSLFFFIAWYSSI